MAPDWNFEISDGTRFSFFHAYASGYIRLLLIGADPNNADGVIQCFIVESGRLASKGVRPYLVLQKGESFVTGIRTDVPILIDVDGQLSASFPCSQDDAKVITLRGNQDIAAIVGCTSESSFPTAILETCDGLQSDRASERLLLLICTES
ncbi:hypothetical protein G3N58_33595 [Paraburkholderia sp. Ac-20342]|uniref:hypothetical protein n=1 Tax=Paraburkholderia sp. Ac-20342 TaxID=2703889 RepID=UPI00197E9065|nr:hypothetical protein [Paraburkholderia sp. Ac-20342]MBN3851693.1 hypothetical protein [Paraburkholderia sp. Ac-20342]